VRSSAATLSYPGRAITFASTVPPAWLEYAFYVQITYSIMGPALGLSFGGLGILMLGTIGAGCLLSMGRYSVAITQSVVVPIACGLSSFAIQLLVHSSSIDNSYVREWIPWVAGVVVLQHLALRRGFLHRASIAMFLVGLATLPFMQVVGTEQRTGLAETVSIANPNDFGGWFGFCCVYFAILGLEVRRQWVRAVAWLLAIACLLILGLSVSRGPLFAVAVSVVFALRRILKKGFLPLLFLVVAGWVTFALGLFDQTVARYAQRGFEDTGRLEVWPLAIARFFEMPLTGVGVNYVSTFLPRSGSYVTPHNAPIFIALSSGLVPLLLFALYGVQLLVSTARASQAVNADAPFHRALLLYAFLISMTLNMAFMLAWMMVIFASVTASGLLATARRSLVDDMQRARVRARPHPAGMTRQRAL
jgi:O-antigen ligase